MGDLYKMFKSGKLLKQGSGGGGGGGTSDYENLENLPSMNGNVIRGAMVSSDLDLPSIEDVESKADANEMEQALQGKADKSTTYTKTEIDTALSNIGAALGNKADKSTIYTKTEVDTALSGKQNAIDSSHKLSADLVDDTSTTNKFATAAELEQIDVNKNNILTGNAALAVYAARLGTNLVNSASGSGLNWAHIPVVVPVGEYVVGFASITSASNTSGKVQVNIMYGENTLNTEYTTINLSDSPLICTIKTTDTSNRIRLYSEQSGGDSIGKEVSYTTAFICPKAVWDSYPSIQPYQS